MKRILFLLLLAGTAALSQKKFEAPEKLVDQPVPYSHKQHLTLGLKCAECHQMADPGEVMGFPATAKCMSCHKTIKTDSAAIQKLASFFDRKTPVPWARVYQIPSYVIFSHKAHLDTGATCKSCHGEVASRDQLWKEVDISMGGCMDCHRANKASLDCSYCHEARN